MPAWQSKEWMTRRWYNQQSPSAHTKLTRQHHDPYWHQARYRPCCSFISPNCKQEIWKQTPDTQTPVATTQMSSHVPCVKLMWTGLPTHSSARVAISGCTDTAWTWVKRNTTNLEKRHPYGSVKHAGYATSAPHSSSQGDTAALAQHTRLVQSVPQASHYTCHRPTGSHQKWKESQPWI